MFKATFICTIMLPFMAFAHVSHTGKKLLSQWWHILKTANTKAANTLLDSHFQATHFYGAQDKKGEIHIIKNLHLTGFTLSTIKETRVGSNLIMTYSANVQEVLNGQPVSGTSQRMTIWKKIDGHWKLIAHASLATPRS